MKVTIKNSKITVGGKTVLDNKGGETITSVPMTKFVNQSGNYRLIGYQAFYKDGSDKFYEELKDVENIDLLTSIEQVGKKTDEES